MRYISYSSSSSPGPLQKVGAILATVAVAATVLVFSSVFFAVLVVAVAIGGIVLWWKTRHVRRMMREMQSSMNRARESFENGDFRQGPFAGRQRADEARDEAHHAAEGAFSREESYRGVIIEGEAVRVDEPGDTRGR